MSTTALNSLGKISGFAPVKRPAIPPYSDGGIIEPPTNKPTIPPGSDGGIIEPPSHKTVPGLMEKIHKFAEKYDPETGVRIIYNPDLAQADKPVCDHKALRYLA